MWILFENYGSMYASFSLNPLSFILVDIGVGSVFGGVLGGVVGFVLGTGKQQ